MSALIVTLDLDWACEPAIEETLDFLKNMRITPTVFITHRSSCVEAMMHEIEVGLHPYFDKNSSHGTTISEVVQHITALPHNLPAYRCHRFAHCNSSKQAMAEAGMCLSSNVCTDLEIVPPFKDRFGLLEVPIFLEDGGYLWRKHSLEMTLALKAALMKQGTKVLLIHPMHFALNTPHFSYMYQIKQSLSREEWHGMSQKNLHELRWQGRGIRDLLVDFLQVGLPIFKLGSLVKTA